MAASSVEGSTESIKCGTLVVENKGVECFTDSNRVVMFYFKPNSKIPIYVTPATMMQAIQDPSAFPLSLKVTNMGNTKCALSGFLFMNPEDYKVIYPFALGSIVLVSRLGSESSDRHSYSVRCEATVPRGAIWANILDRETLHVANGDVVQVFPVSEKATLVNAEIHTIVFEITKIRQGTPGGVDCQKLSALICDTIQQQWVGVGRQLMVQLGRMLFDIRVVKMTVKDENGGEKDVKGQISIVSRNILSAEDVVIVSAVENIVLENTSLKQLDAQQQQVIQAFNLESLGIGGLRNEFGKVFQRAFASRALPLSTLKKLGIKHVKGVLLYGPPGTGKTLIARKIGEILNCREPKIVNGPEVFDKFVGGTEGNIRKLFEEAEAEQLAKGEQSQLHLIIFDEFDAICKQRGAVRDSTGVNDNVVNQLLSKIDGVNSLNNVLLIGMTNRPDLIDDAIKRPGRFEVHVEIGLPNEEGRHEIFRIHTATMRESKMMSPDVNLEKLASKTENYSGAEIEGVVRAATASALHRHIDLESAGGITNPDAILVGVQDFENALEEVQPAFGRANEVCQNLLRGGIVDYGDEWRALSSRLERDIGLLSAEGGRVEAVTMLLYGPSGCGKSAVAADIAMKTKFPYVKVLSSNDMVGYGDMQRVNLIRTAFEDAYKSPASCVILDDIERLLNFSALGGRYSNDILQALLVLVKRPPPPGRKLLVIGTTSNYPIARDLELDTVFSFQVEIPLVSPLQFAYVCQQYGYTFENSQVSLEMGTLLRMPIPIKKVPLILEMASQNMVIYRDLLINALDSSF